MGERQVKQAGQRGSWEKAPPWDESPTFQTSLLPQVRSYLELQHVKYQNYAG